MLSGDSWSLVHYWRYYFNTSLCLNTRQSISHDTKDDHTLPPRLFSTISSWLRNSRGSGILCSKAPQRGEVIILRSPVKKNEIVIKRVIALEGDTVQPRDASLPPVIVPKGYFWIEGDNTNTSNDSNAYGPVRLRAIFCY
jgi:hypothetical protein